MILLTDLKGILCKMPIYQNIIIKLYKNRVEKRIYNGLVNGVSANKEFYNKYKDYEIICFETLNDNTIVLTLKASMYD